MNRSGMYWLLFAPVLLGGCASGDILVQKQSTMEARLEQLAQTTAALVSQVQRLTDEQKQGGEKVASLDKEIGAIRVGISELRRQQADLAAMTAAALTPVDAARIEVVNRDTGADDRDLLAQERYMKAFGLFSGNNYPAAAEAFAAFVREYPRSDYTVNAQYWLGECYIAMERYPDAIAAFRTVVDAAPDGMRAPDALLKQGVSHDLAGESARSHAVYRELVEKYPASEAATKARELLLKDGKN